MRNTFVILTCALRISPAAMTVWSGLRAMSMPLYRGGGLVGPQLGPATTATGPAAMAAMNARRCMGAAYQRQVSFGIRNSLPGVTSDPESPLKSAMSVQFSGRP